MAKFNTAQSFADGDTVTGAKLNNITSQLNIYTGVISEQTAIAATVSTADQLLIADTDNGDSGAANRVTVQKLLNDTLTNGTYTNAQLSGNLNVAQLSTLGTISSTRGTVGILNSTTGTITGLNTTTGTVATLNSTTGTITGLNSTNGTVATLNSTTGTITNLRSTTGTIGNLSTTLAGDFTISQGTGTLGTSGVTLGTYGNATAIPFLTVNAKGIITAATTGTFSTTPADGSITPAKLSQPLTRATEVTASGTSISFTSIPSWARRITVMFSGISTNGASIPKIRLGTSSGPETSGYTGVVANIGDTSATYSLLTSGFDILQTGGAAIVFYGQMTLCSLSGNTWTCNGSVGRTDNNFFGFCAGAKTLAATLDRIVFTTANGTDAFDAGTVNIIYEG